MTAMNTASKLLLAGMLLLTAGLFALDLATPLGFAGGVPYVAVVLVTLWIPGRRVTLAAGLVGALLAISGYSLSPAGAQLEIAQGNRGLALLGMAGAVYFVLDRKRVDRVLRQREARLNAIVNTTVVGMVIVDEGGLIDIFNPAAEQMFGYSSAEVRGNSISGLVPALGEAPFGEYIERYLPRPGDGVAGIERELQGRRRDGSTFPVDLSISEFRVGRRPLYSGFLRDLSERRQLEGELIQAQKMEAVGRLAGGIAHDFNNLLMGIGTCSRLVKRSLDEDSEAAGLLEEIEGAVAGGAALTRQLLDFSRKRVFESKPLDLNTLLRRERPMIEKFMGDDIDVRFYLDPRGAAMVADEGMLQQALMNLVVNARDAMPEGGQLTLETTHQRPPVEAHGGELQPGPFLQLAVRDTGIGMDEEVRHQVFEPFFTTKPTGEGTGLGLAMVYGLVQQFGGRIEVDSEPGQGSVFLLHFPRLEDGVPMSADEPVPAETPGGKETILIVEDERLVRIGLRHMLRQMGYEVLDAGEPAEAITLAEEYGGHIDLLLTDIVMPGMGGQELARELQARRPGLEALYMSAFPDEVLVEQGRLEAGKPTLEKPFDEEQLASAIRAILG